MSNSTDIVAYTYKADIYCPDCIVSVLNWTPLDERDKAEQCLDDIAFIHDINRQDESTFDSGDFPKIVFRDQLGSFEDDGYTEYTAHCGKCKENLG